MKQKKKVFGLNFAAVVPSFKFQASLRLLNVKFPEGNFRGN